jgi:hypothetical protein
MYPFLGIVYLALSVQAWLDNTSWFHQAFATEQAKNDGPQIWANGLAQYERIFKSFDDFVNWLEKRSLVAVFTGILLSLFAVTVLGYGMCMYAMQRIQYQPAHYTGLDANLYDASVYSLSVLTTAPLTSITPDTILAKLVYSMELVSTFLIATVFFGMFSAAKGFHGKHTFKEFKNASEKVRKWIADVKQRRSVIVNPIPQLPPPQPPSEPPAQDL